MWYIDVVDDVDDDDKIRFDVFEWILKMARCSILLSK
jgi:hypothetical protein